jgi:ATP-binding cassette subfamily B protein
MWTRSTELFTSGLVEVLGDVVLIAGALGMMFYFNWRLALVSLTVVPLLIAATAWFRRGAREGFRQVRTKIARLERLSRKNTSRAHRWCSCSTAKRKPCSNSARSTRRTDKLTLRRSFTTRSFIRLVSLISAIGIAAIVWYGGGQVIPKRHHDWDAWWLSCNTRSGCGSRFKTSATSTTSCRQAMVASERIFRLLDTPDKIAVACSARRRIAGAWAHRVS